MTRRRFGALGLSSAVASLAAACGGSPPPATFDLAPRRVFAGSFGGRAAIVVPEPSAIFATDSERIVVRSRSGELAYLPRAQWADRLPRLVQTRIVQSFENAGRTNVGRPGDRLAAPLALQIDIRLFEVQEDSRTAVIEFAAKMIASGAGQVRATRMFSARAPVASIDGAGAAAALEQALDQVLGALIGWAAAVA
jgi:cholesterol transport system auxiliary component